VTVVVVGVEDSSEEEEERVGEYQKFLAWSKTSKGAGRIQCPSFICHSTRLFYLNKLQNDIWTWKSTEG
jgi:hypothetical protein